MIWSPDGEQVLFDAPDPALASPYGGQGSVLYAVPLAGGEVRRVLEVEPSGGIAFPFSVTAHPAGTRIAFVGGEKRGELWMLTGFGAGDEASSDGGTRPADAAAPSH
jgi:Tol biopolymer transport system component